MKKCPFCAEEVQDAAIKCRYCGSDQPAPFAASVSQPTTTAPASVPRDEFEPLVACPACGCDVRPNAEKCPSCGRPKWASQASLSPKATHAAGIVGGVLGVLIVAAPIYFVGKWVVSSIWRDVQVQTGQTRSARPSDPGPAKPAPSAPAPSAPTPAPAQNSAAAENARTAVAKMVNLGLIKRMDVKTGKFYIDGPLWEGFELDSKENIVKVISGYREAEYKGLPQVTLYESRSGKELANYGAFSGVTIK